MRPQLRRMALAITGSVGGGGGGGGNGGRRAEKEKGSTEEREIERMDSININMLLYNRGKTSMILP